MSSTILSVRGLSKHFDRPVLPMTMVQDRLLLSHRHREREHIVALEDISFEVQKGEWVGIYGSNGSGKTTLLRIIAGLMDPSKGSVDLRCSVAPFFDVGVGFHQERHAQENMYIHGLLQGLSPKEIREQSARIFAFAGVDKYLSMPLKCWSSGNQMRLAFATSIQAQAELYLLDEVLAVGDYAFQMQCKDYFRSLRKSGKSMVLVSHGLDQLHQFCDRIIYLEQGKMVSQERVAVPA